MGTELSSGMKYYKWHHTKNVAHTLYDVTAKDICDISMNGKTILLLVCVMASVSAWSQEKVAKPKSGRSCGLEYMVEAQGSLARNATPLWLNANKHGLSSLEKSNGYLRAAMSRPLRTDSARRWGVGCALDVAVPFNYTSKFIVQQAYAEVRWLSGTLTVGSKQHDMEMKDGALSSGAQTFGTNARPVPQVRLALPEYWEVPHTRGLLHLKGHIAYGKFTDDGWQHDFTRRKSRYTDNVLYHSKAGYLKIGNEDLFIPWSLECGLEMASQFGGTMYKPGMGGNMDVLENSTSFSAFWHAFVPGGGDANETTYHNNEGNNLGSWLLRVNYDADSWRIGVYADKFFEDHSAMFQADYNGYGTGDEWNKKKKMRFFIYDFKDTMLGIDFHYKYNKWLKAVVLEYIYSKYQSGPVYHDHTPSLNDHVSGRDNYYNHHIYPGWQHWGQVMGNPLYRSPIYNDDGTVEVKDNRFVAFHLGVSGRPNDNLAYRLLATYQEGLGTYNSPYTKPRHNVSVMAEATYMFGKSLKGWSVRGAFGADMGSILGHNYGVQLTISKSGLL